MFLIADFNTDSNQHLPLSPLPISLEIRKPVTRKHMYVQKTPNFLFDDFSQRRKLFNAAKILLLNKIT